MANDFDYKKEFEKYKKKAQNVLKDNEKIDKVIRDAEEKLKKIPNVGGALSYIPTFIDMLRCYATGEYKEIPTGTLIAICAMLLYYISPIDVIPDVIPILGLVDDAAIVLAGLVLVKSDLDIFLEWRENKPIDVLAKPKKAVKEAVKKIEAKAEPIKEELKEKAKPIKKEIVKAKVKHEVKKAGQKVKKATKKVKKAINK